MAPGAQVLDLGCGNGVLALGAAMLNPDARITVLDESDLAVRSAQETLALNLPDLRARPVTADAFADSGIEAGSLDAVLCNPPFHLRQDVTDEVAWRMLVGARASLRQRGEIRMVGNRHLGYHVKLKRIFGRCEVLASTSTFVVLRALR